MASSACGCAVFPAHTTSSCSPPSCKILRRWRCELLGHRPTRGAPRLHNRADGHLRCVRVEVADELSPQIREPDHISRIKAPKSTTPAKKSTFSPASVKSVAERLAESTCVSGATSVQLF